MITEDGRLHYRVRIPAGRAWSHRLRHVVNPVVGIACGLVLAAALFLLAVQGLFGVRPSLGAVVVGVAAVVVYAVAVARARITVGAGRAGEILMGEEGVTADRELVAWSRFVRWLETEQDFVLASGGVRGRRIVILPKEGIDEDEQDLLREVLHSRIDPDDEPLDDAFVEMNWDEEPARRTAENKRPPTAER